MKKIIYLLIAFVFVAVSCKKEVKKQQVSFNVSGMTCQVGCARKITSDLSKKEGVLNASVNFKEATATIEYDESILNKEDLRVFIDGIRDGKTYKATISSNKKADCAGKSNCGCKEAGKDCSKECAKTCKSKLTQQKSCAPGCEKACCVTTEKKSCAPGCEKACCVSTEKKSCAPGCEKTCCA